MDLCPIFTFAEHDGGLEVEACSHRLYFRAPTDLGSHWGLLLNPQTPRQAHPTLLVLTLTKNSVTHLLLK